MIDIDIFKDDENLSGPGFHGHVIYIDTPDGSVKLRAPDGKEAYATALRWAAARGIEPRIHV